MLIKSLLENHGWKIRKESWYDFDCSNEFAQMTLFENETYTFLTGIIKNPEINYKKIISLFESIDIKFQAELYDENNNILFEDFRI